MGSKLCGCNYHPIHNKKWETDLVRNKFNFIQFSGKSQENSNYQSINQNIITDREKEKKNNHKEIIVEKTKRVSFNIPTNPNNTINSENSSIKNNNNFNYNEEINFITKKNQINKIINAMRKYLEKKEVSNLLI